LDDIELSLRGKLHGFGLKVGKTTPKTFEGRIRTLVADHPTLTMIAEALLRARAVLMEGFCQHSCQQVWPALRCSYRSVARLPG
jgi:transposase